jgi:hypothetical protein
MDLTHLCQKIVTSRHLHKLSFFQYNELVQLNMVYLRGRVKFPIGGNEIDSLSPRACMGRIWCDSKADSIVWMGEDGGSADVQKMQVLNVY